MLRLSLSFLRTLPRSVFASVNNPVFNLGDCKRTTMEPYLDRCYNQNNAAAMCNVPFNATPGNSIYCPSHAYDTAYSVKANVCTTSANCLPGNQILDRQRYKAIRKWKQLEKGKDRYLCVFPTQNKVKMCKHMHHSLSDY